MSGYTFGANIFESLTTGMYKDSKIGFREYIQNACDAIDAALEKKISEPNAGSIDITLDPSARKITIEDNGIGVRAEDFRRVLGNIGDSDKVVGEDKGFRGIGRLGGLAYCRELIFTTKYAGESVESIMKCNGELMRRMYNDGRKHSAIEVLEAINSFETRPSSERDAHFFRVEMIDVLETNGELLDRAAIKNYLSFVAPVPYSGKFMYDGKIYDHARELELSIDEYDIRLDGEQLFKDYRTHFGNGGGEIYDVHCEDFFDAEGNLLAWSWIGVSKVSGQIDEQNPMRGIRLRKENIQLGDDDVLQPLFQPKTDQRFLYYFVGEVHAVSRELIPNARRDYFIENEALVELEKALRGYFVKLKRLCRLGSAFNSIKKYEAAKKDFEERQRQSLFDSADHLRAEEEKLEEAKRRAAAAQKSIDSNRKNYGEEPLFAKFIPRMKLDSNEPSVEKKIEGESELKSKVEPEPKVEPDDEPPSKKIFRVDKFSDRPRSERKLLSRIFDLIRTDCVKEKIINAATADKIINLIEARLNK